MDRAEIISVAVTRYRRVVAWVFRAEHQRKARALRDQAHRAFTEHPQEAGETYLQHLLFTVWMSLRFVYASLVIMIHGAFPFLLETAASSQIEAVYRIMKSRIPKDRRDAIDAGDGI
jgi:hypothetical protein